MPYTKVELENILSGHILVALEKDDSNKNKVVEIIDILKNNYLLVSKIVDDSFTSTERLRTSNLVQGVGIVDVQITKELKGAYETWRHMLRRSYAHEYKDRKPSYEKCEVSEEWLTFSEFLKFYQEHYRPGFQLDKDILVAGNKIYAKETCCFVPPAINGLIVNIEGSGVHFDNNKQKYRATISREGVKKNLGNYNTSEEAQVAYKIAKKEYVIGIANKYRSNGDITEAIADALKFRVSGW